MLYNQTGAYFKLVVGILLRIPVVDLTAVVVAHEVRIMKGILVIIHTIRTEHVIIVVVVIVIAIRVLEGVIVSGG